MEYEVRIGIKMPKSVMANVGFKRFDIIFKMLQNCSILEHSKKHYTDIYYSRDLRLNGLTNCIESKHKLIQHDEPFGMFNLRFCKSEEKQVYGNTSGYIQKYIRQKVRDTFVYKDKWKIDLTKIENTNSYEIEIEALDGLSKYHSIDYIKSVLLKEATNLLLCANF